MIIFPSADEFVQSLEERTVHGSPNRVSRGGPIPQNMRENLSLLCCKGTKGKRTIRYIFVVFYEEDSS